MVSYERSLFGIGQAIFGFSLMALAGIYGIIFVVPAQGRLFLIMWEVLIISMLMYFILFMPYKAMISEDFLEIRTLARLFIIPINNITEITESKVRGYVYAKRSGFPFGVIMIEKYYPFDDKETNIFLETLRDRIE